MNSYVNYLPSLPPLPWTLLSYRGDLKGFVRVYVCVCVCVFTYLWVLTEMLDSDSFGLEGKRLCWRWVLSLNV